MDQATWITMTRWVIAGTTVFLCLYTAAARVFGGNAATVSFQVAESSEKWPIIAFGLGVVIGHWLWPVR